MKKAIFIDKDGTLIHDIPFNIDPARIRLVEGAIEALHKLQSAEYLLILISNQSGVAHGYFEEAALTGVDAKLSALLAEGQVRLDATYYCPHHPDGLVKKYAIDCQCRKPKPGMIIKAALDYNIDLSQSWMIGDILHDVEAGNRAGCKTILINNGNETEWLRNEFRYPTATLDSLRNASDLIIQSSLEEAAL